MCGIVGIVSTTPVADRIVDALKRLEYRGYDSAGLATSVSGKIDRRRAPGKLTNLRERLHAEPLEGTIGIGHTRWATHGAPTEANAHPHTTDRVAIVHNGIIENFRELKAELGKDGYTPVSETDTEIVALMVTRELDRGQAPFDAAGTVIKRLEGAFALAMMFKGEDNLIVGARQARRWQLDMAKMKWCWVQMQSLLPHSPIRSPIWKRATGSPSPKMMHAFLIEMASLSSGPCHKLSWA